MDASGSSLKTVLDGGDGNDLVIGGSGTNSLLAGNGNDTVRGGSGADLYSFSGNQVGSVSINEAAGGGTDTIDFSAMQSRISIDLSKLLPQTVAPGLTMTISGDVENVIGSDFAASITGNSLNNWLVGQGGIDSIYGGAGADRIVVGRRRTAYLDFDFATERGEHLYTTDQRDEILNRMRADYSAPEIPSGIWQNNTPYPDM